MRPLRRAAAITTVLRLAIALNSASFEVRSPSFERAPPDWLACFRQVGAGNTIDFWPTVSSHGIAPIYDEQSVAEQVFRRETKNQCAP